MKCTFRILLTLSILSSAWLMSSAQAAVIWSEDFSAYEDGDDPDGNATATGTGVFNNNQNVFVSDPGNVGNEVLILTADTGRDAVQIDSTVAATCGRFSYDVAYLGAVGEDVLFSQLTEGGRSTGGTPIPGFSDTVNGGNNGISTDAAAPSSVEYFFNVTGAAITYTAPDGSTATLANNAFDFWVDGNLVHNDFTTNPNTTPPAMNPPSSVSTVLAQTFNGQEGGIWQFDNFLFEDDIAVHVPEPSTFAMLGMALAGFTFVRRRR